MYENISICIRVYACMHVCVCVCVCACMRVCLIYIHIYVCIYIYIYLQICIYCFLDIYIYGNPPPMNYRPSFCIVNTVSKQLFRQVRILYLSKTTENKPRFRVSQLIHVRREVRILYLLRTTEINLTFQQDVSVNSFRFDVSTQSTATLCPPNQKPTFPRENKKNQKTIF